MRIITIIPVIRFTYLQQIFDQIATQAVRPDLIVVSDDRKQMECTTTVDTHGLKVYWRVGPAAGDCMANVISAAASISIDDHDLIHIHLDDDLVTGDFYEAHKRRFLEYDLAASFGAWQYLLSDGTRQTHVNLIRPASGILDSKWFAESIATGRNNWAGALTNIVWSGKLFRDSLCSLAFRSTRIRHWGLSDIGALLDAAEHGAIHYDPTIETLFRTHDGQQTHNHESAAWRCAVVGWVAILWHLEHVGLISSDVASSERHHVAAQLAASADPRLQAAESLVCHREAFLAWWQQVSKY